ncbi:Cytochrome c [Aliiroseovarius halocynthiae]|uniref:Cytochrome c n=1 Tax=Aliiroseovarius halocynthiae TaxID=985055 RepID=A0A545SWQ2_9RHOB|nr:cytochrome c [Aliiroseovarius halocynthiae]TQV69402.1 cytochrome c [Aliiroseovarius halocynthiae]SMR72794.1 Cytochrome c [Aliiroseovarius halocynthiae]
MRPAYFYGAAALAGIAVVVWIGLGASPDPDASGTKQTGSAVQSATIPTEMVQVALPELGGDYTIGARAFTAKCAACHGPSAGGLDGAGPPLIHKIYEPSHHGDAAFFRAAEIGVRAHHWTFGNMPPVNGITRAEMAEIVKYLRAVQRANGIS